MCRNRKYRPAFLTANQNLISAQRKKEWIFFRSTPRYFLRGNSMQESVISNHLCLEFSLAKTQDHGGDAGEEHQRDAVAGALAEALCHLNIVIRVKMMHARMPASFRDSMVLWHIAMNRTHSTAYWKNFSLFHEIL